VVSQLDRIVVSVFVSGSCFEWDLNFWTHCCSSSCYCYQQPTIGRAPGLDGAHWTVIEGRGGGVHPMAMTEIESRASMRGGLEEVMLSMSMSMSMSGQCCLVLVILETPLFCFVLFLLLC